MSCGIKPTKKIGKDLRQAEQVFQALLELRCGDITLGLQAAGQRGKAFRDKLERGLEGLDGDIAGAVRELA